MTPLQEHQPQVQQTVVLVGKQKSVGAAFLLAFLFRPMGLLYASVMGGIVMMILAVVIGVITFGFALIPIWIVSVIWAVVAANQANRQSVASVNLNAPVSQDSAQPAGHPFNLVTWFDRNRRSVAIAAAGAGGLLLVALAFKFVLGVQFGNRPSNSEEASTAVPNALPRATVLEIDLPTPRVPITPAASVLPAWTQSEDIEGNYPVLTGLYVGALGKRPFKLVISSVDTVNKKISGYSETSTATTALEGTYTLTIEEPNSRVAENVIDFRTWVFQTTLLEPRGISGNGVFQLRFECTDVQGSSVHGTWTSWDGRLYREIRLTDTYTADER
jgi:hypothetical protein